MVKVLAVKTDDLCLILGPARWKEKTDSHTLSSASYTNAHPDTYNINKQTNKQTLKENRLR